jgi:hypothetical protein
MSYFIAILTIDQFKSLLAVVKENELGGGVN